MRTFIFFIFSAFSAVNLIAQRNNIASSPSIAGIRTNGSVAEVSVGRCFTKNTAMSFGNIQTFAYRTDSPPSSIDMITKKFSIIVIESLGNNKIHVKNKPKETLMEVFSPDGKLIHQGREDIIQQPKGLYIIKIGHKKMTVQL